MRKVVIHSAGGYEKLKIEEQQTPAPGPGEVLVRIAAAGVNYADVCIRWGIYESAKKYVGWPITPGFEFAGTVEAVGPGVKSHQPGARVMGLTRFNAYATHIVVPESFLFPIPQGFSMEEAAGFPTVFLTAYHGLHQNVAIRPGMKTLVHSAAGGVGSALVQLAKLAQHQVVGVVGASHKMDYVRELGADAVIDKSSAPLWKEAERIAPEGFDLVFDANGPATLKQSYEHLRPTGKVIAYGFHSMLPQQGARGRMNYLKAAVGLVKLPRFNPLQMTNENKSIVCFNLSFLFDRMDLLDEAMRDLLAWVAEGKLRAPKVTAIPLDEVARAHRLIESGQTSGKLVLVNPA